MNATKLVLEPPHASEWQGIRRTRKTHMPMFLKCVFPWCRCGPGLIPASHFCVETTGTVRTEGLPEERVLSTPPQPDAYSAAEGLVEVEEQGRSAQRGVRT